MKGVAKTKVKSIPDLDYRAGLPTPNTYMPLCTWASSNLCGQ
jgi:hypothetical protein